VRFENAHQGPSVLWESWPGAVATFENVSAMMGGGEGVGMCGWRGGKGRGEGGAM